MRIETRRGRKSILLLAVLLGCVAWGSARAQPGDEVIAALGESGLPPATARSLSDRWQAADGATTESLVELMQGAREEGAPVELVADKAMEGLAKHIPPARLLAFLQSWTVDIARSAEVARELRAEIEPKGISEREATLRLSILARTPGGMERLQDLRPQARARGADLARLLRVGEAVGELTQMGVESADAVELGGLWLAADVQQADIGRFVRVIDSGRQVMAAQEVAKRVSLGLLEQQSPETILQELAGELGTPEAETAVEASALPAVEETGRDAAPGQTGEHPDTGPPERDETPGNSGSAGRGQDDNPGRGRDDNPGRGTDK